MGKRLFFAFLFLVAASSAFVILYVQSSHFARLLRQRFSEQIQAQLGIVVDFDRIAIQAIPPGIAVIDPVIKEIKPGNALKIPTDSVLRASQIGLTFRMFQTFGSRLVVNRVFLKDATIRLRLDTEGAPTSGIDAHVIALLSKPIHIRLESGLELDIRQFELKDSRVDLSFVSAKSEDSLHIGRIKFFAFRPERALYSSVLDLEGISWKTGQHGESIDSLRANLEIDPNLIRVISLDLTREGMNVHFGGTLAGDISVPKKLKAQLRAIGRASAAGLAKFDPVFESLRGTFGAEVTVDGTLAAYTIKGKVDATNFGYELWNLDQVNGELELTKNDLRLSYLKARRHGGELTIEPFSTSLDDGESTRPLRLKFNNVDFQEFAGELKKDVNELEMLINGSIEADIRYRKSGRKLQFLSAVARPQLQVTDLELTNQHWGKTRPREIIFGIKNVKMTGQVAFRDGKVRFEDTLLGLSSGTIVANGSVDAKSGWDLVAVSDSIDLGADLRQIVESPVSGVGALRVSVKGPASHVFIGFDVDLQNASYVNLDLGALKGNVTLDDKESKLILKDLRGSRGAGKYELDGIVDVSGDDAINLRLKLADMVPDEVFRLFKHQLRNIDWIPWGMTGKVSGNATVGGRFTDPERTFDVRGRMEGQKLVYRGEMLSQLQADFRLKDGVYSADDIQARKYNARISGNVAYGPSDQLQYRFEVERGRLRDVDYFARLGVPVNASVAMNGWGKGRTSQLKSHTEIRIDNAHVGTFNVPPVFLKADSNDEMIEMHGLFGDQNTRFQLRIARSPKRTSELDVAASGQNFSFLVCLINSAYCGDKIAAVNLDMRATTSWKGWDWQAMNGELKLNRMTVEAEDFEAKLNQPVAGTIRNGYMSALHPRFTGTDTALAVDAEGAVSGGRFETRLRGTVGLQAITLFTSLIRKASGLARIDASMKGSVSDLKLSGRVDIEKGTLQVQGISPGVEELSGRVLLGGSKARVERLEGKLGQGKVAVDGSVDLYLNRFPVFALGLNLQDNRVRFEPVNLAEIDRGRLTFTGDAPPYVFGGRVKMRKVLLRKNFDIDRKGLRSAKYLPTESFANFSLYTLRIEAVADDNIFVQNDLFDAEFKGSLLLQNNFEFPRVTGSADLVKGKLLFRNSIPFELDHAVIKQSDPEEINPWFSLGGSATVSSYKVTLFANGYSDDPKISFSSSPGLPQEDILSLLAFGYIERRDATTKDPNAVTYTEVGSILLDQLRLNKDLKSRGFNVRVTPIVVEREANIIRPRTVQESTLTKIQVQTQVVRNVDASLGTSVGSAQSQYFDMNVEYHLNDKISVQSVYEQDPGVDAGETRRSVGGDLKFKWGFK